MSEVEIVVVGSLNLDIVVPVERLPRPGETVLGGDHVLVPGGKGANQAVAAARLGRRTAMVGRVGDDDAGRRLLAGLADAGVDATHVRATAGTASGIALIAVDGAGENAIVVSPGANGRLDAADVVAAQATVSAAAVVLLQLEVPVAAVLAAAEAARGTVVLNPAPALPLPDAPRARRRARAEPQRVRRPPLRRAAARRRAPRARDGAAARVGPGRRRRSARTARSWSRPAGTPSGSPPVVEAVDATARATARGALGDAAGGAELVEAARWVVPQRRPRSRGAARRRACRRAPRSRPSRADAGR